eukprot:TRINITY_DN24130_c0_g1_i2.p2 TRINITY_DN24130_c0_g1~~TRINITY_DN24130_c0_g1_i2.p2  ORF type:complete len:262 (-),score=-16.35 TRINITY_DN24130_c0_g1_i2:330-1016(-)
MNKQINKVTYQFVQFLLGVYLFKQNIKNQTNKLINTFYIICKQINQQINEQINKQSYLLICLIFVRGVFVQNILKTKQINKQINKFKNISTIIVCLEQSVTNIIRHLLCIYIYINQILNKITKQYFSRRIHQSMVKNTYIKNRQKFLKIKKKFIQAQLLRRGCLLVWFVVYFDYLPTRTFVFLIVLHFIILCMNLASKTIVYTYVCYNEQKWIFNMEKRICMFCIRSS